MNGIKKTRNWVQNINSFLDWSIGAKTMTVVAFLTLFILLVLVYTKFILYWDVAGAYIHRDHASTLLHITLSMLVICISMMILLAGIIKLQRKKLIIFFQYVITLLAGVMLFIIAAYLGFINIASGFIGTAIPVFAFVVLTRQLAYFITAIAILGFLTLGYLVTVGIIPLDYFYIDGFFNKHDHYLFHSLSTLYFALPILSLLLFSFDRVIIYWKEREGNVLQLSRVDELTGLLNRRTISHILMHILLYAQRNKQNLSIILVDIDLFKRVNDTYGHLVGDTVIGAVSKILLDSVRSGDHVGRYGGEEFLMVLQNTNEEEARFIAERCRIKIEKHITKTKQGVKLSVTASFGIYTTNGKNETLETVIKKADQQLYLAKENDRNTTYSTRQA